MRGQLTHRLLAIVSMVLVISALTDCSKPIPIERVTLKVIGNNEYLLAGKPVSDANLSGELKAIQSQSKSIALTITAAPSANLQNIDALVKIIKPRNGGSPFGFRLSFGE